jgi:hypothetical protein
MYELGVRKMLFVGAAPLGCCPILRQRSFDSSECHAEANSLSVKYNVAVDTLLRDMSARLPDFRYSFFNTSTALLRYIQEPEANGTDTDRRRHAWHLWVWCYGLFVSVSIFCDAHACRLC